MTIKYKYNEGDLLRQITDYVNSTYDEHYSQNKFQATEFIIDGGHGVGFTIGNIMKYAQRYGHKGTPDDWRKDLMKVIHYAIIALNVHDKEQQEVDDLLNLDATEQMKQSGFELRSVLTPVGDTITLNLSDTVNISDTVVADWSKYNMGTSSLLTTQVNDSITINDKLNKKSKKKKD